MRIAVVLPEPLGPRMPKISPARISNDTPSTAVVAPKRLVSPCTSTTAEPLRAPPPAWSGAAGSGLTAVRAPAPPPARRRG